MALRRRGARRSARGHELFPGFTDVVEIGVGSLAVVFRAREISTNRQVALKLLNVRDASPRSIESFERESIALGALSSHPNIVTLYRTFRTPDGRPVLVLELCTGAVSDRVRGGAGLPVPEAVSIGIKVAGALETAHRGGILHRDVKPQNILVTEFGEPALADFGVAMLQSATQTTAGLFDFTTLHAAPELLEGGGTSAATDVYELASTLYQLIAGQAAFRAYHGESPAAVILRILRDPVRPLSNLGVPIALSDLLIRAMSKQMDQRPPTAAEFAAELAEVEIAQGWNRTQFLIRDPGPVGDGVGPTVTRMPDAVARAVRPPLVPRSDQVPAEPVPAEPVPAEPVPAEPVPAEPVPAAAEPASEQSEDWSTPTLVTAAGWRAPPPGADRVPVPVATDPDRHWSPPPPSTLRVPRVPAVLDLAPTPPAVPPPDPAVVPQSRPRRVAVRIDDDYFPAHRPPGIEAPTPEPPPAVAAPPLPASGDGPAVPVWAVRAPSPLPPAAGEVLQFSPDLSFDPMALPRTATVRSGAAAVRVTDAHLVLRSWLRRTRIEWPDVQGFEAHRDDFHDGPVPRGYLVALTSAGPVELPGTRRPMSELGHVHALLESYRIRAQRLANR